MSVQLGAKSRRGGASVLRMRRCVLLGILLAGLTAAPAHAAVKKGPAGSKFYTPASKLVKGSHGSVIYARRLTGHEVLSSASANRLVLYRSTGIDGKPTAVSGAVALPRGKAPKGGWPVITWAHGTTGIADSCSPTRTNALGGYDHALLQGWLKSGYAVVRTDYAGLGTPGDHPYLIGASEGRAVLDMVRAARKLEKRIGRQVIVSGHSQGGHAALWAAALASKWTPELNVRGTVAFAPASHLGEQLALLPGLTSPSGLSGLASLIVRALDDAYPSLRVGDLLSTRAAALYPQTRTKCLPALARPDSFGGLAPADLFKPGANLAPLDAKLNANDPEDLRIKTPVLVEQGTADTTVFPAFTQQLVDEYVKNGVPVTYKTYTDVNHGGIVTAGAVDAAEWISDRLP
jgi:pimeloyl-ACP methyl ester carboxylesterase